MLFSLGLALAAPFPDLLAPAGAAAPSGASAVVIGLEDYGFLPDVPYARRDAAAVRTVLTTSLGLDPQRVRTLNSGNREQILAAVDEMAAAGSPVYVWFSGHGATSATDGSMLLVGDDAKAEQDAFEARSVSVAQLTEKLPAGSLVVVDACAAGKGRDGAELLPGVRFAVPSYVAADEDVAVWTAASPTELAEPYPEAKHGLFTAFAVGALRGWGDADEDGLVTLQEAQAYVERAFATLGAKQAPTLRGQDRVLSRATEASPDLGALPAPGSVVSTTGDAQVPDGLLGALTASPFEAPYRLTKGSRVADTSGKTLDINALIAQERSEAIDKLVTGAQADAMAANLGMTLAATGLALGAVPLIVGFDNADNTDRGMLIGGVAATVVGVPLTVLGIRGMARKRQRVVDEVNRAHGFD